NQSNAITASVFRTTMARAKSFDTRNVGQSFATGSSGRSKRASREKWQSLRIQIVSMEMVERRN
ncbi:hypothetical protein, partial [Staphylococcus aureus]